MAVVKKAMWTFFIFSIAIELPSVHKSINRISCSRWFQHTQRAERPQTQKFQIESTDVYIGSY